ncbi:MAG: hypothetical protein JWQ90_1216 [Hydrocarboniphaga sp.]|nr:hypothetical protein [Hydrocarboniphaga sp.]MDB5968766.1 hypothetical protein [Hydrocarboniphaga sp.]
MHIKPHPWLWCMHAALNELGASVEVREMLELPMFRMADAMRTRDD